MIDAPAPSMDLSGLFSPESIGVIGASRDAKKIGSIVVRNILDSGYSGLLYPINPKAHEVHGVASFPDYLSLPKTPQLAVFAVPAETVLELLPQVAKKGTKYGVIFSAGFGEMGPEGKQREKELIELAKKHGIALLGPNCLGFVNNSLPINVTFGQVVNIPGNMRFISQSGAIASSIFDWAAFTQFGFSDFITLGNKNVVDENDILEYWLKNKTPPLEDAAGLSSYQPVGMYLESIEQGERFVSLATEMSKDNPVFLLKPGKSEGAQKAMQSHTGAIAGEDAVLDAALKKAGVIRCEGVEDLFDFSRAFAWENAPKGPSLGIVSNAGGPAVISTDIVEDEGLELAHVDEETRQKLNEHLPRAASLMNPIDVLGDALADRYVLAADLILAQENVDSLLVILTPQMMTQIEQTARGIGKLSEKHGKPIICSFMGGSLISSGEKVLSGYKIPSFRYPERAIRALARMWQWQKWRNKLSQSNWEGQYVRSGTSPDLNKKIEPIESESAADSSSVSERLNLAISEKELSLSAFDALVVLQQAGAQTPEMQIIDSFEAEKQFAQKHDWPVVLKLSSPDLLHKKDVGGIETNITNADELTTAVKALQLAHGKLDEQVQPETKLMIQKQISGGVEVITGIKRDPHFGLVLMFGAGGTMAELIADRNLLMLPASTGDQEDLVLRSKIAKLLSGYRGSEKIGIDQILKTFEVLSRLTLRYPQITEIEINPLIVTPEKAWSVDGKILLSVLE